MQNYAGRYSSETAGAANSVEAGRTCKYTTSNYVANLVTTLKKT